MLSSFFEIYDSIEEGEIYDFGFTDISAPFRGRQKQRFHRVKIG